MKIAISSYHVPVSVANYLRRAALRLGHEVVLMGSTSGNRIPWPDSPTRAFGGVAATDLVESHDADIQIDVDGALYDERPAPCPRALVLTDPHIGDIPPTPWPAEWRESPQKFPMTGVCEALADPRYLYEKQRAHAASVGSKVFCMQWVQRRPDEFLLPYAYDPEWHQVTAPLDITGAKATLLGAPYVERQILAKKLNDAGLRTLGPGRGLYGKEYAAALCSAPVAVVWPLRDDVPGRAFEALACGRRLVMKRVPACEEILYPFLASSKQVTFVDTMDEAVAAVAEAYSSEAKFGEQWSTSRMAATGRHSWDDRLEKILLLTLGDGRLEDPNE